MNIGIKVGSTSAEGPIPALAKIELYCVETGETITGVREVHLEYTVCGAIEATVKFFPSEIRGTNEQLYPNFALPEQETTK